MDIKKKAKEILENLSIQEKISLLSGKDCWHTKDMEHADLPSIMVSDGPHGLRKQEESQDNFGVGVSVKSTCFPTASLTACSFDTDLIYKMGKALGEECRKEKVSVLLGPGINMKRSPLCGRNFEYFSEDPLVAGKMGAGFIKGVQSEGIGTSLKHFAANNQEKRRMSVSAQIDERTLNEYYLKPFEIAVKESSPWTVMCSYNKINGTYSSENKKLLTDILRNRWNYDGLVVSDWGAVHNRTDGIKAGLDLEMPGNGGLNNTKVLADFRNGKITEDEINKCAERVIELVLKAEEENPEKVFINLEETHHELAVQVACESAVLLKNENETLPLSKNQKISVIGEFAEIPRYQGAGSSKINPLKINIPLEKLKDAGFQFNYAKGYDLSEKENPEALISEAISISKDSDILIVFAGLPTSYETEGLDRTSIKMPKNQLDLIERLCETGKKILVVLMCGAPVELPFKDKVSSILLMYLSGQGVGTAVTKLISGEVNPSGKLAETWILKDEDCPTFKNFPGDRLHVNYEEGFFTGYRFFSSEGKPVAYPFSHGLSYTTFEYSELKVEGTKVSFTVRNTGKTDGKETSFVFVSFPESKIPSARLNLAGFSKTEIKVGESKRIEIIIDERELSYFDVECKSWKKHEGKIIFGAGSSIDNLIYSEKLEEKKESVEKLLKKLPEVEKPVPCGKAKRPFTMENCLADVQNTLFGKLFIAITFKIMDKTITSEEGQDQMMKAAMLEMPFFSLWISSSGMISEKTMKLLLWCFNHFL
ncbi:MAG: beta-glucosidase [Treponema sp.]|nr:beta-glucosidase [Treponema sp.]